MSSVAFDSANCDSMKWLIVNDDVMGGCSKSMVKKTEEGTRVFEGKVSLENNGGFSMVRYQFENSMRVGENKKIALRIKGDGKRYQVRIRSTASERHSYVQHFHTTGEWESLEFNLCDFYPTFRGRTLEIPNYPGKEMEEIAFLIGNKKQETFRLEIASIQLK